ncbi:hypothetical protein NQ317_011919 [Molorchus minor]|uniref:Uncharacterized protein n=1 Tax=Molorchus minor TaxID=1323400 RepID=A0ABQ9JIF8_9CUCU|nr:hypothetical protein NQ317_011919 [Molorchus minor]
MRQVKQFTFTANFDIDIFDRYSSLTKLQRVYAYCLRFIKNAKIKGENRGERTIGALSIEELNEVSTKLIRHIQEREFSQDLACLERAQPLPRKSKLLTLNPFLDKGGLVRVGGRIANSSFQSDKKYPILLPQKHKFTDLLIRSEHVATDVPAFLDPLVQRVHI